MSELDDMVVEGYREAMAPRVRQLRHRRAWEINGMTVTDLLLHDCGMDPHDLSEQNLVTLMQMRNQGVI